MFANDSKSQLKCLMRSQDKKSVQKKLKLLMCKGDRIDGCVASTFKGGWMDGWTVGYYL